MITAGEFRKGVTIELDGNVFNIVDFQHAAPARRRVQRTRIKNVMTGAVLEQLQPHRIRCQARAVIETKEMTYLYSDGDFYYFTMDVDTYEQIPLGQDVVEDAIHFVKENTNVTVRFLQGHCVLGGGPNFGAGSDRHRARRQRRYRHQRHQARDAGNRLSGRADLHQPGREDLHRYPHRRAWSA